MIDTNSNIANLFVQLHPADDVLVALCDLPVNTEISFKTHRLVLLQPVNAKHKFFITDMPAGAAVKMYGVLVGTTTSAVKAGMLMSVNNIKHAAQPYRYTGLQQQWIAPDVAAFASQTFMGYHRSNGKVGTANYWLFIPTVFCENRNLDVIKEAFNDALGYAITDKYKQYAAALVQAYIHRQPLEQAAGQLHVPSPANRLFQNIDGIKFLNHQGGCGGTRQDAATLGRLLAAYANHPNVAGITVLSLGCQHLQTSQLLQDIQALNSSFDKPVLLFEQQQAQSEEQLIKAAIADTFTQLIKANQQQRQPAPLSKLCMGVKCGGSDGFSGISANPAVGFAADLLVALGGQVLLAEFPELCGAEQDILDRCIDEGTAQKFIKLMESYNAQAHAAGSGFHMNPSPGNIKDGLITDAIKSAGAAKKGGTSPVVDVLDYTEPVTKNGLSLVCTPGNDVEATTGKAAAGANLILFTTGLGTPTGNPVCPVIKLSTTTTLAQRMPDIIDVDCGSIITGQKTIEQMGVEILQYCIQVASGVVTPKAVQLQQDDFIPWKRGVSL
jgi:altronate hydrolase